MGSMKGSDVDDNVTVLDGLYPGAFVQQVQDDLLARGWTYSEGASRGADLVHWVTEMSADEPLVLTLRNGFQESLGVQGNFRLSRVYCNAHVCSDCPLPHRDSSDPRDRTILYYANAEWRPEFAGETVIFDDDDEIAYAVLPRPGRVVIFNSALTHCARPPTKIFLGLRLTVAFKFIAKA